MTICPCCGFKFEGSLSQGCEACGARSVGEPLPKPEHELPSYGRSLLLSVIGALMVLSFLIETIVAFVQRATSFSFWSWAAAAETAAWRLKWIAIPITILVIWGTRRLYRSMLQSPADYCGLRYARAGFFASATVPMVIALLIGITVPERLSQRQVAAEAGSKAMAYATNRVLLEYQKEFGTYPADKKDLARLPDPDGSIAALLRELDAAEYKPSADWAAAPTKNPQPQRGAVIRNASFSSTAEPPAESLSFTNYELRFSGPDKVRGTADDLVIKDGVFITITDETKPVSTRATATTAKP